jgi:mRNA interferase MazF
MKRGEVRTVAGGGDFSAKPRPVVILQDDRFADIQSVTFCPLTTNPAEAPLFRIDVQPSALNGLDAPSRLMVDKITTLRRTRLGRRIGELSRSEMADLRRALLTFLGFAGEASADTDHGDAEEPQK